ncbi:MAG TPA: HD domain-containing protein, partial [Candidatus Paceibacterota bacterium]|nr:HD domain-containing protein [Candidatus Paceibacterota bacterium]
IESGVLSEHDIMEGVAAAILHDQRKNGTDPNSDRTSIEHARIMSQVIEQHGVLADDVVRSVRQHMGPWGEERPDAPLSQLVHIADMFASRDNMSVKLSPLIPEELSAYADWSYLDSNPSFPQQDE